MDPAIHLPVDYFLIPSLIELIISKNIHCIFGVLTNAHANFILSNLSISLLIYVIKFNDEDK